METRVLKLSLAVCTLVAVLPFFPWVIAVSFDSVGDPWQGALGALAVTVPVALGLAAIILASHGLLLHELLVDDLEENLQVLVDQGLGVVPVAAGVAAAISVGATPATPAAPGAEPTEEAATSRMKATVTPPATVAEEGDDAAGDGAVRTVTRKVKDRAKRRGKAKARYALQGELNRQMSRWRPRL